MRRREELGAWFDTWIHLGSRCYYMLEEKRQTAFERKEVMMGVLAGFDLILSCEFIQVKAV